MLNLPATFPIRKPATLAGLPVLVDLAWFGTTMTRPDAGIIRFANADRSVTPQSSDDDSLIL